MCVPIFLKEGINNVNWWYACFEWEYEDVAGCGVDDEKVGCEPVMRLLYIGFLVWLPC